MANRKYTYLVCDFETTVYKGQTHTEVWASASVQLGTEDVKIFSSIDETFSYFKSLKTNVIAYYHNLKFDGNFWLSYLLSDIKMKQASNITNDDTEIVSWIEDKYMQNNTFKYSISSMGMWYEIVIKVNGFFIRLRDSLKLLPFSVKAIGSAFKTKHQKLDMEYEGFRYSGCTITDKEREYIANDVLVVKEALEIMFKQGHNKLTIGSCCLSEFKSITGKKSYESLFPDLYEDYIDEKTYGSINCGEYIRKSYKGGWCYLVKGKENKIYHNGTTADVNSLYPSMMSSESGNRYPVGYPKFWKGNTIPEEAMQDDMYFFIRFRTRFYIKEGKLPFVQIKGNLLYSGTECLESSDIVSVDGKSSSPFYIDFDGNIQPAIVEMTMTCVDYILFREHYHVVDFEILDGCYFNSVIGIFDEYIEKYKKQKLESKGALRTLAKLFLNNLYGKMASSQDSSFKYAYLKEDGVVGFRQVEEYNKKAGYIAVGSAITSYARNFTIRSAQKNFNGAGKRGFIYADTDSIHCDLKPEEIKGITVHDKNFCCWKLESCWDEAIFVRQKTYIEHVTHNDLEPVENPYYDIKCAGMPDRCKNLFQLSMQGYEPKEGDKFNEEQLEFLKTKRTIEDFKTGLKIYGKLKPKTIQGGVLLVEEFYEMRPKAKRRKRYLCDENGSDIEEAVQQV